jgi:dipeptidyl aminopeptidase/acylaminoacyl peptidase
LQPSFSPDGRNLLVFHDAKLKRIAVDGGSPQTIAEAPSGRSATWGANDQIVYQPAVGGPLFTIPASGGTPRPLPDAKPEDNRRAGPRHPYFLPDGKHFLFNNLESIYVASIDGGPARLVVKVASRAEYANGRLLYVKDRNLFAHPFDLSTLAVTGEPERIVERVGASLTSTVDAAFSVSTNGTLAYWEGHTTPLSELIWLDRAGRRVGSVGTPGHTFGVSASADLSRLALEAIDLQSNWYSTSVLDVQRGGSTKIPLDQIDRVNALTPILSRDGRHLWFSGAPGIFRVEIGAEQPELLGVNQGVVWLNDVSPDGRWLLYQGIDPSSATDIWALPLAGDATPKAWLQTPAYESTARFSPDGRWVAYLQGQSDGLAVFVDAFPERGRRQRVSPGRGLWPMWNGDGTRLYYLTPETHMMEVPIAATKDGLRASTPVDLFAAPTVNGYPTRLQYVPAPDGQRFLFNARLDAALPRTVNIVLNWPALLAN